jgi:hypothetical protein
MKLCFFAATESGEMPTVGLKDPSRLGQYLPQIKNGWTDKVFRIFEVFRPAYQIDQPKPSPEIRGVPQDASNQILTRYIQRNGSRYLA